MSAVQKTFAIILSRRQYGEADHIVSFFSRDIGRQSGIAKSSLISSRRFGGGLEPGTIGEISYRKGRGRLCTIEGMDVQLSAIGLMKDDARFSSAMSAIELGIAFLPEAEQSAEKFSLLKRYLEYISQKVPKIGDRLSFDIAWLKLCGYAPSFSECCYCKSKESRNWAMINKEGGVSCEACASSQGMKTNITDASRLRFEAAVDGEAVSWTDADAKKPSRIMNDYIVYILGRPLRARAILNQL